MLALETCSQPLSIPAAKGFGTWVEVVQENLQEPGMLKTQRRRNEVESPLKSRALARVTGNPSPRKTSCWEQGSCEVWPACSGLGNLHRWSMHKLPGKPLQLPQPPWSEQGFPYIHSEPPSFQFLSVVSRLLTMYCCKQQSPPHCDLKGCWKVPPVCPSSWLSQIHFCTLSTQGNCSSPHHPSDPLVYGCVFCAGGPKTV